MDSNTAKQTKAKADKMWAEIQKAQKTTIENIVNGTASKKDIDMLHRAIASVSKLAADVFDRSIAMVDKTAQKIAERESNNTSDKEGETISDERDAQIMREAVRDELKKRSGDILKAVEEIVSEESNWPVPEGTVMRDGRPDPRMPTKEEHDREVLHKTADNVEELLKKISDDSKKHGNKPIADIKNDEDEEEDYGDTESKEGQKSHLAPPGKSKPTIDHASKASSWLREGKSKHKDTESWRDKARDISKEWWRNFKQWSTGWIKPKSMLSELANIAGMAALFTPQFREWIADEIKKIKDWLTFDNVKETLSSVWEFITREATALIDRIRKALGLDGGAKEREDDKGIDKVQDFLGRTEGGKVLDKIRDEQKTLNADDHTGSLWSKAKHALGYSATKDEKEDAARKFIADAPSAIAELEKQAAAKDAEAAGYLSGKLKPPNGEDPKMAAREPAAEAKLMRQRIEKIKADLPKAQDIAKNAPPSTAAAPATLTAATSPSSTMTAAQPPKAVSADNAAAAAPPAPPPADTAPASAANTTGAGSTPAVPASKIPSNDDSGALSLQNSLHGN